MYRKRGAVVSGIDVRRLPGQATERSVLLRMDTSTATQNSEFRTQNSELRIHRLSRTALVYGTPFLGSIVSRRCDVDSTAANVEIPTKILQKGLL